MGVEGGEIRVRKVKHEDRLKRILNKEKVYGRQNRREDVPVDKPGHGVLKRRWGEVGRCWEGKDESPCGGVLK